jgi:hypothetical protein
MAFSVAEQQKLDLTTVRKCENGLEKQAAFATGSERQQALGTLESNIEAVAATVTKAGYRRRFELPC